MMPEGVCRLTGEKGKFVKCHLIPKALTRPEKPGLPLIQSASGKHAIKRFDSWYDRKLVTRKGEDVFRDHDTWAIKFLRKEKLLWSGWGPRNSIEDKVHTMPGTPWGLRLIQSKDCDQLRLYFLSLLWRAGATDLSEFSEIKISSDDLEKIGDLLMAGDAGDFCYFPITLTQLSTKGAIHNLAPIVQIKTLPDLDGQGEVEVQIFRFYMDGLIAHIHPPTHPRTLFEGWGDFVVAASENIRIHTVTYESSWERENLNIVQSETLSFPKGYSPREV